MRRFTRPVERSVPPQLRSDIRKDPPLRCPSAYTAMNPSVTDSRPARESSCYALKGHRQTLVACSRTYGNERAGSGLRLRKRPVPRAPTPKSSRRAEFCCIELAVAPGCTEPLGLRAVRVAMEMPSDVR
jgi:hypothetical protein